MIYIEKIENHKISQWTKSEKVANSFGWTIIKDSSEIEKSDIDGCFYLAGFAPMKTDEQKLLGLKEKKVNEAIAAYNAAVEKLAKNYPTTEMLTFTQQIEQAQNITTQSNLDNVELVRGIAVGRQITEEDLAKKILLKNTAFQYPCGVFLGRKQRVQDLVEQAQTEEEVQAIDVAAIFAEPIQSESETEITE